MLPREILDRFETPDHQVLTLARRGDDFFVELDDEELMSTRRTGSEIALAELGCRGLGSVSRPRVLIGGLGLGFTLRAALEALPRDAQLVVAELFPQVVEWNRTHLKGLYGGTLDDRRLRIVTGDVWKEIGRGTWNAILLDTDNGPEAFCVERNHRLYGPRGLESIRDALLPGGTLAIWSASPEPRFVKRLRRAGFEARMETVREHRGRGARYTIFVARAESGRLRRTGHPRRP